MNGAESLVRTLVGSGIEVCFANPGTSEMHFVASLDKVEGIRCVLGLAETVVTGCADGYARMAGKPAATLLHCGPGLANGIANIHNGRRANSPMVNIVGDQAISHRPLDPPLAADTEGLARAVSHWVRTSRSSSHVARDGAAAVQASRSAPGQIATLILPSDVSWGEGSGPADPLPAAPRQPVAPEVLQTVARILRSREPSVLLLDGQALGPEGLEAANRVAFVTGATLRAPLFVPRMACGRGRVPVERVPFGVDAALASLSGTRHLILAGATPPVAFFAYPGKPGLLVPPDATIDLLARPEQDAVSALEWLADELGAPRTVPIPQAGPKPTIGSGPFTPEAFATTLAALLPENAIIAEDAVTSGRGLAPALSNAAPHDFMRITGGAIGHGFPCATGAAVACRDRRTVCLQADGAGMYSLQALWTQAREKLDVVNVVFANRMYRILHGELLAMGATPGRASADLFDLSRPDLDWVRLANGMGVEAERVETLERFAEIFRHACAKKGPYLIEFRIP
jgi:acetolactate synthase I/II/III large subunit